MLIFSWFGNCCTALLLSSARPIGARDVTLSLSCRLWCLHYVTLVYLTGEISILLLRVSARVSNFAVKMEFHIDTAYSFRISCTWYSLLVCAAVFCNDNSCLNIEILNLCNYGNFIPSADPLNNISLVRLLVWNCFFSMQILCIHCLLPHLILVLICCAMPFRYRTSLILIKYRFDYVPLCSFSVG